jgi:thiol:disulfide interchange protein DsbD
MSARFALLAACFCLAPSMQAAELIIAPSQPSVLTQNRGVMPVDEAFAFNMAINAADGDILLTWEMPKGYYLYRKSLKLESQGSDRTRFMQLPEGTIVTDEFFGESQVYFDRLVVRVPSSVLSDLRGAMPEFQVSYQGCLQDTYCYPPAMKSFTLTVSE